MDHWQSWVYSYKHLILEELGKRMKITIVIFCLVGAVYANPILYKVILEQSELESSNMNQTQRLSSSASQSPDQSDTSELKSSEESTSEDQSSESESESLESNSESSESHSLESESQSLEDRTDSNAIGDTRDNSQGSEENVRKNWIRVFAVRVLSAENNSSSEVKGQLDLPTNQGAVKQSTLSPTALTTNHSQPGDTVQSSAALALVESFLKASGSLSETSVSIDTSDVSTVNFDIRDTSNINDTSDSSESSESSESSDTSESSDSSNTSESKESDTSESEERHQSQATDCQKGVHSTACDSEEYFFQDIGDDGRYPMDDLLMPEEEHRELSLRR
ncbi:secretory calcium-binding phosphoprotein 1 [Salvelinus alpinus]|uniref:secretory calcium-binding phosphoprotein 1 n=1 Tax=Salvelinus alpinus TaxID=8036 RepID=UPI0039FBCE66